MESGKLESFTDGGQIDGFLKEQLGLEVGYSTTVRYLHELGYNLRVPRTWRERQNEEERNAFLDSLRLWQADAAVELWFADECGWRAIRVLGGAGALGAVGPKCLISETISEPTSSARSVRLPENALR